MVERGYLVNRITWSLYLGLVALVGAVTILALPPARQIEELAGSGGDPTPFFAGALLVAFGVFAMNLGQAERRWKDQFKDRYGRYLVHIASQLLLGLLVTAPSWLIFKVLAYVGPLPVIWGGAYLLGYGFVLAAFGLVVGTLASEIAQFQLKYLCLVVYLAGSFFWPPGSPLFNLVSLLEGQPLLSELAPGFLILAALGGALLLLAQRRVKLWKGNSKGASYR
jgi:hypothetical protein